MIGAIMLAAAMAGQSISHATFKAKEPVYDTINRWALLKSVAMMESSGGKNKEPVFEPGFLRKYGNKGIMPKLRKQFGDKDAASSFGKYQILLCTATEYGFNYTPQELQEDKNNERVAIKILATLISKQQADEERYDILSAIYGRYNGSGYDSSYARRAYAWYYFYDNGVELPENYFIEMGAATP